MLTVYSINITNRHRKMFYFFASYQFSSRARSPIESGRNHRSACFQQSLLPTVFPTFPCDTNIPGHMTLPYPFTRKIAAIQISFVFQCNARNSRREMHASPAALVIPSPSLTRAFGSFERQACEIRHDRNSFWDFHSGREGFRRLPGSNPAVRRKHRSPSSFSSTGQKPHTRERRAFEHQIATKQGFIRTTKKAATEVTALNMHLFALLYLAKPMARRSRMTVTRIWPG